MAEIRVECPGCRTMLLVPDNLAGRKIRCAFCKTLFDAARPKRVIVEDEIIANWLQDGSLDGDPSDHEHLDPSEKTYIAPTADPPQCRLRRLEPAAAGHVDVEKAHSAAPVSVVHISPNSVEFEFSADRLLCPEFRCAMPRRCVQCGETRRLRLHLVIFAPHLIEQVDLNAEHRAGHIGLSSEQLGQLQGVELLARLPMVPSVPFPGNLPFPYYVCERCNHLDLVAGQIHVNSETHKGTCRLLIRNIPLAADFFSIVGQHNSEDHRRLLTAIEELKADPWLSLPVSVRHRVEQWFRRFSGESFLAYVRDADYSPSELGMSGLIISTRRIVYHRPPRHREATVEDRITIRVAADGDRQLLSMESPQMKTVALSTDRIGLKVLRQSLRLAGVHVFWN